MWQKMAQNGGGGGSTPPSVHLDGAGRLSRDYTFTDVYTEAIVINGYMLEDATLSKSYITSSNKCTYTLLTTLNYGGQFSIYKITDIEEGASLTFADSHNAYFVIGVK